MLQHGTSDLQSCCPQPGLQTVHRLFAALPGALAAWLYAQLRDDPFASPELLSAATPVSLLVAQGGAAAQRADDIG